MDKPPITSDDYRKEKTAELQALREHIRDGSDANTSDHHLIKDVLTDLRLAIAMTNERMNSTRTVAVVVWTLFLTGMGGIGWVVSEAADVIQGVDAKLDNVHVQQRVDAAKGWQWAAKVEAQDAELRKDVRELQKLHRIQPEKD
jgi:hypothetical protein